MMQFISGYIVASIMWIAVLIWVYQVPDVETDPDDYARSTSGRENDEEI